MQSQRNRFTYKGVYYSNMYISEQMENILLSTKGELVK